MHKWSATTITLAALAFGLVLAAASTFFLLSQPWLGVVLKPDLPGSSVYLASAAAEGPARAFPPGVVKAIRGAGGKTLAIEAEDLVEEPDFFDSYARLANFLARQTAIHAVLKEGAVQLEIENGGEQPWTEAVEPGRRPVTDLPAGFWVQIMVGLASFIIGAWVWSLRRTDPGARLFALTGVTILLFTLPAALYSTRELALDGGLLRVLSALNHAGAMAFGAAMIALFLTYPVRIVPARMLLALPLVVAPWFVADALWLLPEPALGIHLATLTEMVLIVAAILLQYWFARRDPVARAVLRWIGLSVVVGAGGFVLTVAVPLLFGFVPSLPQGYAFLFFLLIYAGLALGVSRYRLFELDVWAFRILFYTAGAALLLGLDAVLLYVVALDRAPAFGIALLLVAFLYLPLRDALARRFATRKTLDRHALLRAVVDVAFGSSDEERAGRWQALLGRLFDPLEFVAIDEPAVKPEIRREGLELIVPALAGVPALLLHGPWGGRGLFRPDDVEMANQLVGVMRHVETSREAYERGAVEERRRIAADLHDDVGARLLTGLHHHEVREIKEVLREAMADIRTIAVGLAGDRLQLGTVLADLRHEAGRRLERAGIDLSWMEEHIEAGETFLDYPVYKNLVSAHRELVSNAIRHSCASRIEFTVTRANGVLRLILADDGEGFGLVPENGGGSGLANVRRRIAAFDGSLVLGASEHGGARIELALPLGKAVP
jgi:signal transduction histidine kinase